MRRIPKIILNTGTEMPVIGLGTWLLNKNPVDTILKSLKNGYDMIDTSSDYDTQASIGMALKKSAKNRALIFIVTKVEETDDSYNRVKSNLAELELEWVDLVLIHRPPKTGAGIELWKGLIRAKNEGLVKDIGVSSYTPEKIDKLIEETDEVPVVNQVEWTPFGYSNKLKNYLTDKKIILQAYSPLTHGKRLDDEVLKNTAQKYDKTPAQILLRWDIQQGFVPLPKANDINHQKENLDIFDFELEEEDIKTLNSLNEEYSSIGELTYLND